MSAHALSFLLFLVPTAMSAQTAVEIHTAIERGRHINGERVGRWQYYDKPGAPNLVVDYTTGRINYFDRDTTDFYIYQDNSWKRGKLDIPCRFHGSIMLLRDHYQSTVQIPAEALKKNVSFETTLVFEVTEAGVAANPEVVNDTGYGMKRELLQAFSSAPNHWIAGATPNGKAVRTRLAITFAFCAEVNCKELKAGKASDDLKARHLLVFNTWTTPRHFPRTLENTINPSEPIELEFSPDGSKVISEAVISEGKLKDRVRFITDIKTRQSRQLPFTNILGATWIDSDKVLFKFRQLGWPVLAGVYDYTLDAVFRDIDSATYFQTILPGQKMAFARPFRAGTAIWQLSLSSGASNILLKDELHITTPVAWSADGQKLIVQERDNAYSKFYIYDLKTSRKVLVPIYNTRFLGWTTDSNTIYLTRYRNYAWEILKYNVDSDVLTHVVKRSPNLRTVSYCQANNKMILGFYENIHLLDLSDEKSKPEMVIKDVRQAAWTRDGSSIGYISDKDGQIYLYNITRKATSLASQWRFNK
jgi:hypothetical protein